MLVTKTLLPSRPFITVIILTILSLTMGITFTHVTDPEKLAFLDLEICHDGTIIHASTYVKPTAGNFFFSTTEAITT